MNAELFNKDHSQPTDCQVLIAITGTREGIIERLREILQQTETHKPIQGTGVYHKVVSSVITRKWGGKDY